MHSNLMTNRPPLPYEHHYDSHATNVRSKHVPVPIIVRGFASIVMCCRAACVREWSPNAREHGSADHQRCISPP